MSNPRGVRRGAMFGLCIYLTLVFIVVFILKLGEIPLLDRIGSVLGHFHERNLFIGVRYGHIEAAANVAFFVPLGALVPLVYSRPRWIRGWLLCFGLSVFIETTQLFFLPGRVASMRDVVCNAVGAGIGVLLTFVLSTSRVFTSKKSPVQG